MAGPAETPSEALRRRKAEYLERVCSADGTALLRGYVLGAHPGHTGRRPTHGDMQRAVDRGQAVGPMGQPYDSPIRRGWRSPVGAWDSANLTIARLWIHRETRGVAPFEPPFPATEPPPLDAQVRTPVLLSLATSLGCAVTDTLGGALDPTHAPQLDPVLAGRVAQALRFPGLAASTEGRLEAGAVGPLPALLSDVLPVRLVRDLSEADAVRSAFGPGITPEGLRPLRSLIDRIALLGVLDGYTAREGLAALTGWMAPRLAPHATEAWARGVRDNPFLLPLIARRPGLPLPEGWSWPDWTASGLYWWRRLVLEHVVVHLLSALDTADFHVHGLIRLLSLFDTPQVRLVPEFARQDIRLGLLHFKYWWDEAPRAEHSEGIGDGHGREADVATSLSGAWPPPAAGGAEMTFWSENHQVCFLAGQVLVGQRYPADTFWTPGPAGARRSAREGSERALGRLAGWMERRLRFGFVEWNSPGYYNEDLVPLLNLVDFLDETASPLAARVKVQAAMLLDLLFFDLARRTSGGTFGAAAGRAYATYKAYGWDQQVGDVVELAFGTRGDFVKFDEAAPLFLATSRWEPPEALLAIGRDRLTADRRQPFTDRSRVGLSFDEAPDVGIGFEREEDIAYWWSCGAYFAEPVFEGSMVLAKAYPDLARTKPLSLFWVLHEKVPAPLAPLLEPFLYELAEALASPILAGLGLTASALPFPFNLLSAPLFAAGAATAPLMPEGLVRLAEKIALALVRATQEALEALGLLDAEDKVTLPRSVLIELLYEVLRLFGRGSALTRANLYTWSNGDAMLSSAVDHQPGELSFQKQTWQAALDCGACVWTTAPMLPPDDNARSRAWAQFLSALATGQATRAVAAHVIPALKLHEQFGGDGPNLWTGSTSLPRVAQHEHCVIATYAFQDNWARDITTPQFTHAWFPKIQFTEVLEPIRTESGTWVFARKDHYDPERPPMPDPTSLDPDRPFLRAPGRRIGAGYVALFSWRDVWWETPWELRAADGSNVWVCVVGNEAAWQTFDRFVRAVSNARLVVDSPPTGGGVVGCSFDVPEPRTGTGRPPRRLAASRDGVFLDGAPLTREAFPRFENRYVTGVDPVTGRPSPGVVPWGGSQYQLRHPASGAWLAHDLEAALRGDPALARTFNRSVPSTARARRKSTATEPWR